MAKRKRKLKKKKKPERSQKRELSVFVFCVAYESGELSGSGCGCCLRPLTTRDWFTGPYSLFVNVFVYVCLWAANICVYGEYSLQKYPHKK